MNLAHFCEFWCFSSGKQARFTLNFCSGMPLRKVHELTFLWFGLPGPLLIFLVRKGSLGNCLLSVEGPTSPSNVLNCVLCNWLLPFKVCHSHCASSEAGPASHTKATWRLVWADHCVGDSGGSWLLILGCFRSLVAPYRAIPRDYFSDTPLSEENNEHPKTQHTRKRR